MEELFTIQFGSLKYIDLLEQGLLNPITLEEFFLVNFFQKITVNRISCSKLEEEMEEENDK